MDLTELANLVVEIAERLKKDDRIICVGKEHRISEVELVLQGPSSDFAGATIYGGTGGHSLISLEEIADIFVDILQAVYDWKNLAKRYDLLDVFINVKRWSGLVRRRLCEKRGKKDPGVPGDPLIVF